MGDNVIHYLGHVRMMGAVQPFISGAISKTVNMPEDVTVEDVEQLHLDAWRLGLKAVAVYRDNCKVAQPLSTTKKDGDGAPAPTSDVERHHDAMEARGSPTSRPRSPSEQAKPRDPIVVGAVRERLPRRRRSNTFAFRVADCEGYVTVGEYEDGRPGELFMRVSKQGSTLAGIMDAFSISISLGLQHGVPLSTYVRKYTNMKFEPAGMTDDARAADRLEPRRLHLPAPRARLPHARGARGPRRALDRRARAADAAGRRGAGDGDRRDRALPHRARGADVGGARRLVEDPAARRPLLLQLRQRDAACGVVLRLRVVRVDLGLLLASFAPRARRRCRTTAPRTAPSCAGPAVLRARRSPGCSPRRRARRPPIERWERPSRARCRSATTSCAAAPWWVAAVTTSCAPPKGCAPGGRIGFPACACTPTGSPRSSAPRSSSRSGSAWSRSPHPAGRRRAGRALTRRLRVRDAAGTPRAREEAFVVHLLDDGAVRFDVVAFSRPGSTLTRLAGPIGRVAQSVALRGYLRALHRFVDAGAVRRRFGSSGGSAPAVATCAPERFRHRRARRRPAGTVPRRLARARLGRRDWRPRPPR